MTLETYPTNFSAMESIGTNESWETIFDFTEVEKEGVLIDDVLRLL